MPSKSKNKFSKILTPRKKNTHKKSKSSNMDTPQSLMYFTNSAIKAKSKQNLQKSCLKQRSSLQQHHNLSFSELNSKNTLPISALNNSTFKNSDNKQNQANRKKRRVLQTAQRPSIVSDTQLENKNDAQSKQIQYNSLIQQVQQKNQLISDLSKRVSQYQQKMDQILETVHIYEQRIRELSMQNDLLRGVVAKQRVE